MEVPKKIDDCYFYYYSTCMKGDNCSFRHEPNALGSETVCFYWTQGECFDLQCKLRHMELKKNRKQIPCYWEKQPGGCKKKHCSFRHVDQANRPDAPNAGQNLPSQQSAQSTNDVTKQVPVWEGWQGGVLKEGETLKNVGPPTNMTTASLTPPYMGLPQGADPLVVNFGEESDNESVAASTPIKSRIVDLVCKESRSQELLQLDQIQNEVAAFYDFCQDSEEISQDSSSSSVRTQKKLPLKYENLSLEDLYNKVSKVPKIVSDESKDFRVLSLEEIRQSKRKFSILNESSSDENKRKLFRKNFS